MNNKLKKLTWKYFIQQKIEELSYFLVYVVVAANILLLWVIISMTFHFIFAGVVPVFYEDYLLSVFAGTMLLFVSILLITWILHYPTCWIMSNWKKAKKRARKELRK